MLDIRYFGIDEQGNNLPQKILANEVKKLLQEYPIGGVILFRENLDNKEQIKLLTQALQNIYPLQNQDVEDIAQNMPRFIAIDEEGGVVSRVGLDTIGNMALGAINNTNITMSNAKLIGTELNNLGINFNFAPVVDINSNPRNPIIGVRAFGDDPELVIAHAKAFILGLSETNVISCIKHFPGHGDTATDTHHGTTILNKMVNEIDVCELYPYKKLIADGCIDAVMTAHIIVPALDNNMLEVNDKSIAIPATLSYQIVTNILRKKLKFNGVVVTDALDMQAISHNFNAVTATVQSIKAGCDVILMPIRIWDSTGISKFKDYFNQVYNICSQDLALQARVKESYLRIIAVKNKLNDANKMHSRQSLHDSVLEDDNEADLNYNKLFCHPHVDEDPFSNQHELAKKAITLYKNEANHIPFNLSNSSNILIIADSGNLLETTCLFAKNIASSLFNANQTPSFEKLLLDYQNIDVNQLKEKLHKYSHIIVLTYNLHGMDSSIYLNENELSSNKNMSGENGRVPINKLFLTLNEMKISYVMLSCRNPYDINYARNATTNILLYGTTGFDQTNYKITPFTLNLKAALNKILAMDLDETYNKFTPVSI